jgi:rRNA-processing protein FCF1
MQIVINDTSCLIDLRKAGLLHATLLLPYAFKVALPLVHSELLDFSKAEIDDLVVRGLAVVDLPPEWMGKVFTYRSAYPGLSFNDCLSLTLAESEAQSILLTGDQNLRNRATAIGIEVHGVLWVSDQLVAHGQTAYDAIHAGLCALREDPLVHVPHDALAERIRQLRDLLGLQSN